MRRLCIDSTGGRWVGLGGNAPVRTEEVVYGEQGLLKGGSGVGLGGGRPHDEVLY